MLTYFIVISAVILLVARRLFSAWGDDPSFEEPDEQDIVEDDADDSKYRNYQKIEDADSVADQDEFSSEEEQQRGQAAEVEFDVKRAILYSEILRPKWRDFD